MNKPPSKPESRKSVAARKRTVTTSTVPENYFALPAEKRETEGEAHDREPRPQRYRRISGLKAPTLEPQAETVGSPVKRERRKRR